MVKMKQNHYPNEWKLKSKSKSNHKLCSKETQSVQCKRNERKKGSTTQHCYPLWKNWKNSIKVNSCTEKEKRKFFQPLSIDSMTIMKCVIFIILFEFLPTTTQQKFSVISTNSPQLSFRLRDSSNNSNSYSTSNMNSRLIRINGDIILGGIFPMHEHLSQNREYPCGAIKEEKGIQRLEAMLFAIDRINNDPSILKNITLGTLVIDSCSSDTYALEQSMEFVRYYMNQDMSEYSCESGQRPIYKPHKPVTGVIGASFSVVSIMVANVLRLFRIPQISYASTSVELSDKTRFEYFSRVVPPDNFQAQAMAEIVISLKLTYTSTVAVEGEYGEKGIASFLQAASRLNICVAVSEKILRNSKEEDFERIIKSLYSKKRARAVVIFVDEDNVRKLLRASIRLNMTQHFYWIASDSWGAKSYPVRDQEFAAVNAITILPHRVSLTDFDKYFLSLKPQLSPNECQFDSRKINSNYKDYNADQFNVNCRNIWFNEFWSQHHKCTFDEPTEPNVTKCTGNEDLSIGYEQEGLVPFVVDAVYAIAKALDDIIKEVCHEDYVDDDTDELEFNEYTECVKNLLPKLTGQQLLKYIHNVKFKGPQGTEIRFNEDGDAYGYYNIYQYQKHDNKYDYVPVGTWKESLNLQFSTLKWQGGDPISICSDSCPIGYIRNFQDQCCWRCVKCAEDAYVLNDTCKSCVPGHAPNEYKTNCTKLNPEIIDWLSPWALVPLIFSSIGIFFTIFTTCVFIRYNKTPVIKASGRELCYVLLTGILCCYCMSFVILAPPNVLTCALLRIGIGLCLSICYSAIFIKTNRISRIFNQGVKSIQRPLYTSPLSQVTISSCIVGVQLLGSIAWLVYDHPDVKEIYPFPLQAVLTCKVSTTALMMSLIYNITLILLCTIYAFKTRKIPENFNEAKYIGFTMYSTCIVWLSFIPIYFGTKNDYKIQLSSLCMCLSISATVVLGCLFTPKVYLVLFQPYKNVRPRNNGAGGQTAGELKLSSHAGRQQPYSMRLTTSNTPVSTTTSFDLIENNQQPKRTLISSMSSTSMSGGDCGLAAKQQQQQQQRSEPIGQEQLIHEAAERVSRELPHSNGHSTNNYQDKVNDVIIDPLTIATIEAKPHLSAKSSPTASSS